MRYLACILMLSISAISALAAKTADFDGDGRTDLSVFRPGEGNWYIDRSMQGFQVLNWGISTDRITPGDFDADGKTDLAVFRPAGGDDAPDFYILRSSDFTVMFAYWGVPGDTPVVADYDGDERDDVAVYRQSNNNWYVLKSTNGQLQQFRNVSGGRPAPGDFDGDNKADFCNYPGTEWFVARSASNYTLMVLVTIGGAQDRTAAADYDADGRTDAAIYNPTTGTWVIRFSSTATTANIRWGNSTDLAVPGDYDGDGVADIAIYRDGTWWLRQSYDGVAVRQFGLAGDVPIPNRYLP